MAVQEAKASFSIPSLIAIGAAIASLFVGALGGLILATIAIFFGVIGFALSLSARTRGGVVSVFSMLLAGIGVVVAIFKALGALF